MPEAAAFRPDPSVAPTPGRHTRDREGEDRTDSSTSGFYDDPVLAELQRWRADNAKTSLTDLAPTDDATGAPTAIPAELPRSAGTDQPSGEANEIPRDGSPPSGDRVSEGGQRAQTDVAQPHARPDSPIRSQPSTSTSNRHFRHDPDDSHTRPLRHIVAADHPGRSAPSVVAPTVPVNGKVPTQTPSAGPARSEPPRAGATLRGPHRQLDTVPATAPAIEAVNLHKRFKDMVAVEDVSFTVPAGSIVALLGPNGAGKTTTVNMLCTLLKPDGGSAKVAGHDVLTASPAVRRSIMLTGQFAALDESLTGRENLILFGRLLGLKKSEARKRADELLDHFSLVAAGGKRVGQYSGGMRRRIDIACGLVTSPKVVFLDEPTTGLDPRSRQDVWSLVEQLKSTGVTTLLTTQYLEEADMLSDNIVVIDRGRVIAEGTSDQLKSRTGSAYCDVTPEHAAELPRLLGVLRDLLPAGQQNPSDLRVSVPAPNGADTLVEVVRRTTSARLRLSDVTMRRPSLDEVFLHLTDPEKNGS